MISKFIETLQKKSLKERFLFVIGMLFFLIYLTLGVAVIFWQKFPLKLPTAYRVSFGVLLIVYSFFRFFRFFNNDKNED